MALLTHLILSVFGGYGLAVALVEKKRQWPIRRYNILLKKLLARLHPKLPKMLNCTVCTSFWTAGVIEVGILLFGETIRLATWGHVHIGHYWTWPVSGFIAIGFTWTMIMFMEVVLPPPPRREPGVTYKCCTKKA